ncbi:glycosyltransferase family 2 protein, partial [Burkholderia multivorans]
MTEPNRILVQRFEANRKYTFGVVVLTQGKRLEELNRGFDSLLAQKGVELDIVCVGNGWDPEG